MPETEKNCYWVIYFMFLVDVLLKDELTLERLKRRIAAEPMLFKGKRRKYMRAY